MIGTLVEVTRKDGVRVFGVVINLTQVGIDIRLPSREVASVKHGDVKSLCTFDEDSDEMMEFSMERNAAKVEATVDIIVENANFAIDNLALDAATDRGVILDLVIESLSRSVTK